MTHHCIASKENNYHCIDCQRSDSFGPPLIAVVAPLGVIANGDDVIGDDWKLLELSELVR